jgi:DnaJ-class molecular chaperone
MQDCGAIEVRHVRISRAQAEGGVVLRVPVLRERCEDCGGRGYSVGYGGTQVGLCRRCEGVGRAPTDRTVLLELPKGVPDGARLRVHEQGALRSNGQRDDLVCVVHVDRIWEQVEPDQGERR